MFSQYPLNNANEIAKFKARKLLNRGLVRVGSHIEEKDKDFIEDLRYEIESVFKESGYPEQIDLNQIKNEKIQNLALNYFSSSRVKDLFKELSKKVGEEVTLFPFVEVMRNYFSGPQCGLDGWHCDAGGEYPYKYCKEKMASGKYIFGKLSFSLQNNGKYGGNIDIAKSTFKNNSKKSSRQRISSLLSKIFFKFSKKSPPFPFGLKDQWLTDVSSYITGPKTLNPDPLEIIAFEHRLYHRGTPISPQKWREYLIKYPSLQVEGYRIPKEFNFNEKNKYTFYAHFGNFTGLKSYIYDRSRRKYWLEEKKRWLNQYEELDLFKKEFSNSRILFRNALKILC